MTPEQAIADLRGYANSHEDPIGYIEEVRILLTEHDRLKLDLQDCGDHRLLGFARLTAADKLAEAANDTLSWAKRAEYKMLLLEDALRAYQEAGK